MKEQIEIQREKLRRGNPHLNLVGSCRIGNGIRTLDHETRQKLAMEFLAQADQLKITHFIPASGSGSRMFDSLYQFLNAHLPAESHIEFVENLINRAEDFAFYNKLPQRVKNDLKSGNLDIQEFIRLLLFEDEAYGSKGMNFGNLPKGLIPFHRYGNFIVNPFQEHILQGVTIAGEQSEFHFTINEVFSARIHDSIRILKEITGINFKHSFSNQNPASDAFAFGENLEPEKDASGNYIRRPAGHGALLVNLNQLEADLIFIRNIDNIQHQNSADNSIVSRQALAAVLLQFKKEIAHILEKIDNAVSVTDELKLLNERYDLQLKEDQLANQDFMHKYLNRPIRICGMVRNEGQPGGGPFWVKDEDGLVNPQIVEKSQISNDSAQLNLVIKSTHFNPVEIICSVKNYRGAKFNLPDFRNDNQYFIVQKTHQGKTIQYIEEPGLWNGSMHHWLTLFYEIDSDSFSPVKTVLDLLKPLHQPY